MKPVVQLQTLMLLAEGWLVSGALDRDKVLSIGIVLGPLSPLLVQTN